MELPQADGKLIRAGRIENMKRLLSILEINSGTTRRSSFQVALPLVTIFAAASFIAPAASQARDVIHKGDVVVVALRGEVSPSLLMFLRRAEKAAEGSGASAMIFEMDTYGGRLDAAADIVNALNRITIPTYTFINSNAGSAGAIIALATQHIYMAPVSAIGAAAPFCRPAKTFRRPRARKRSHIGPRSFAAPRFATGTIPILAKRS